MPRAALLLLPVLLPLAFAVRLQLWLLSFVPVIGAPLARLVASVLPISVPLRDGRRRRRGVSGASVRVAVVGGGIAGASAAWALKKHPGSAFNVTLFEARDELGGNAKTHVWDGNVRTGLSVLAWPDVYFKNYRQLLASLQVPSELVRLPFMVAAGDQAGNFIQSIDGMASGGLRKALHADFTRWARMVVFVRAVNFVTSLQWLRCPCRRAASREASATAPSFYTSSLLNPCNVVPLRLLSRWFGVSKQFWQLIVVPMYSSTFLSTQLDWVPAAIVPIVQDVMPVERAAALHTWAGSHSSKDVFTRMTRSVDVRTSARVVNVVPLRNGQIKVSWIDTSDGSFRDTVEARAGAGAVVTTELFDRVVLASPARTCREILAATPSSWLERFVLSLVSYCDEDDDSLTRGVIHTDTSVLPDSHRAMLLDRYANFIDVFPGTSAEHHHYENTFCVGSWCPAAQEAHRRRGGGGGGNDRPKAPMLVTYNLHPSKEIDQATICGTVDNRRAHPHLSPLTMLVATVLLRLVQSRRGVYFASSFTTPGNGHDLSLLSGLCVAHAMGAAYPFEGHHDAKLDFLRLRRLMGL